uniref:Uncharacterized protein n=1 Tax=Erpetoichthys calabaricus TaxID=27687 RepID=A0A8C4X8S2_ERPCA
RRESSGGISRWVWGLHLPSCCIHLLDLLKLHKHYFLTHFAIYQSVREKLFNEEPLSFYQKVLLVSIGGFTGEIAPMHLDGLFRVWREEGLGTFFFLEQSWHLVERLWSQWDQVNIFTQFLSSQFGSRCATFLCHNVLKSRLMNYNGEYRNVRHCMVETGEHELPTFLMCVEHMRDLDFTFQSE